MKIYTKQLGCKAVLVTGAAITQEMLAKINGFALKELTADDVYVRKFLLCHSAVDRDRERFPEAILDDFAATLPGKSLLAVHDRRSLPLGLWFDTATEEMSVEQFKSLTGVTATVPAGKATVKVLWAWSYLLQKEFNAQVMENMDAGIYRHVSIGFAAADIVAIKTETNGPVLYYEYVGPGEAQEGSLVWLGAQPGATTQKVLKDQDITQQEVSNMKILVAMLVGLGMKALTETATEEQIAAGIKQLMDEKDAAIAGLKADAALGKAYKDKIVADYVGLKYKLGEVSEKQEDHTALKAVAEGLPFSFLESEVKALLARVEAKLPPAGQLEGDLRKYKSADNGADGTTKKTLALVAG
jgi:hypothetical protein